MSVDRPLLVIVPEDAPVEAWKEGRAEGVTASEAHAIAQGGRGTWRRILTDELNGSRFKGNRHTERGHEREEFLLHFADERLAVCRSTGHCSATPTTRCTGATLTGSASRNVAAGSASR